MKQQPGRPGNCRATMRPYPDAYGSVPPEVGTVTPRARTQRSPRPTLGGLPNGRHYEDALELDYVEAPDGRRVAVLAEPIEEPVPARKRHMAQIQGHEAPSGEEGFDAFRYATLTGDTRARPDVVPQPDTRECEETDDEAEWMMSSGGGDADWKVNSMSQMFDRFDKKNAEQEQILAAPNSEHALSERELELLEQEDRGDDVTGREQEELRQMMQRFNTADLDRVSDRVYDTNRIGRDFADETSVAVHDSSDRDWNIATSDREHIVTHRVAPTDVEDTAPLSGDGILSSLLRNVDKAARTIQGHITRAGLDTAVEEIAAYGKSGDAARNSKRSRNTAARRHTSRYSATRGAVVDPDTGDEYFDQGPGRPTNNRRYRNPRRLNQNARVDQGYGDEFYGEDLAPEGERPTSTRAHRQRSKKQVHIENTSVGDVYHGEDLEAKAVPPQTNENHRNRGRKRVKAVANEGNSIFSDDMNLTGDSGRGARQARKRGKKRRPDRAEINPYVEEMRTEDSAHPLKRTPGKRDRRQVRRAHTLNRGVPYETLAEAAEDTGAENVRNAQSARRRRKKLNTKPRHDVGSYYADELGNMGADPGKSRTAKRRPRKVRAQIRVDPSVDIENRDGGHPADTRNIRGQRNVAPKFRAEVDTDRVDVDAQSVRRGRLSRTQNKRVLPTTADVPVGEIRAELVDQTKPSTRAFRRRPTDQSATYNAYLTERTYRPDMSYDGSTKLVRGEVEGESAKRESEQRRMQEVEQLANTLTQLALRNPDVPEEGESRYSGDRTLRTTRGEKVAFRTGDITRGSKEREFGYAKRRIHFLQDEESRPSRSAVRNSDNESVSTYTESGTEHSEDSFFD